MRGMLFAVALWLLAQSAHADEVSLRLGGKEVRRNLLPFNGSNVAASGYGWPDLTGYLATMARAHREPGG